MQFSDNAWEMRWPSGERRLRASKILEIARGYDKNAQSSFDFRVWILRIMLKSESVI